MDYPPSLLTVVTPASDYNLVSLAATKDELDVTDSSIDTRLTRWLREAKDAIEAVIGRVLRAEAVSEVFRWSGLYYLRCGGRHGLGEIVSGLLVKRYPIQTVTQITEDTIVLVAGTDYEVDQGAGIIYRLSDLSRIPWSGQQIEVEYIGGYLTADDIPGDIQTACLTLLKHRKSAQTRDPTLRALSIPGVIDRQYWVGGTGDNSAGLPPEVLGLIERYRDLHV